MNSSLLLYRLFTLLLGIMRENNLFAVIQMVPWLYGMWGLQPSLYRQSLHMVRTYPFWTLHKLWCTTNYFEFALDFFREWVFFHFEEIKNMYTYSNEMNNNRVTKISIFTIEISNLNFEKMNGTLYSEYYFSSSPESK